MVAAQRERRRLAVHLAATDQLRDRLRQPLPRRVRGRAHLGAAAAAGRGAGPGRARASRRRKVLRGRERRDLRRPERCFAMTSRVAVGSGAGAVTGRVPARPAADPPCQLPVGQPRRQWPGIPLLCAAAAEHQICLAGQQRPGQHGKLSRVEAAVAIAEAHQVAGRRQQPGVGGCPKPRADSGTTIAPSDLASSSDPSVEPLSTTVGRKPTGIRSRIQGNASASLRHVNNHGCDVITIAGPAPPVNPHKPENSSFGQLDTIPFAQAVHL
jgi:hypothetical protein